MTDKERSQAIVDYAAKHVGGPYIMGATAEQCTPNTAAQYFQSTFIENFLRTL
jgi:hypothetical protein